MKKCPSNFIRLFSFSYCLHLCAEYFRKCVYDYLSGGNSKACVVDVVIWMKAYYKCNILDSFTHCHENLKKNEHWSELKLCNRTLEPISTFCRNPLDSHYSEIAIYTCLSKRYLRKPYYLEPLCMIIRLSVYDLVI